METRRVVVVSGGMGTPSSSRMLADQLGEAARRELERVDVHTDITTIELRELAVDIANNMVTGFAPPALADALKSVADADALIVVSPVFSGSYSGLLKSFFDVLDNTALDSMPVLIAATGGSVRHSLMLDHAMRPLFTYLRARVVSTGVYAGPEDWGTGSDGAPALDQRVTRAAGELAGMIAGTTTARRPNSAQASLPFEQLLAQVQGR
ncbi:NADPH-dependent FMN reductase [Arthrobacter sp. Soil782]|uniref:FMN reductase n=1 Tax=Arthrobacter sp. Soil782 TaxID=1736410 RepID=UPI0006F75DEC|nr:FMN reductase [Arthrobacter sp. Soil782]KRF04001.1 NADPH-dependent FMN reductase [Arthrobacter sp. Soil782]